jgi:alpha-ribazole phosphatase
MEIFLIRHTTPMITEGLIYGRLDVPLTASFLEESVLVVKQLPETFDAVYSSPSSRCTSLATLISPSYQTDEALYEFNFGDWEGSTWDAVAGPLCDEWMSDFVNSATPNGESMLQMQGRVLQFFKSLLSRPVEKVAVVTHGGVIRILLAHYRSILLKDSFAIKIEMGEVVKLQVSTL